MLKGPRHPIAVLVFGPALCLALACSSNSSSSDNPPNGTGGSSATGGASGRGGASGSSGSGGTATGGSSAAGGANTGGTNAGGAAGAGGRDAGADAGSGSGGSNGTDGGADSVFDAARTSDAGAATDGGVGDGGVVSCTGRAVSLSANGTSMDSDGAQAEVVIDLGTALPIGNASRTVEFWAYIKPTDWVGDRNEIYYYGAVGTTTAFGMDFGTNAVSGMPNNHATLNPFTDQGFNADSTNYLGIDSSAAQWVHIAMTWDGMALRTYVNGVVRITTTATGATTMLATRQSPLMLGCNPENMACFNGWFDELRVWNIARSDQQIMASYNRPLVGNEAGLVGYWKFDDAPGSSTAADSVMGQPAHAGMLRAAMAAQTPTFITPSPPPPLLCP